ncbi:hypothetical protein ROHU_027914 [Labeo rohita]|uniref:Uncharacterized protein n=1 Tax=Labeo rohita TaxID=84645 RepID=A0A498M8U2_LABRO|nr:hypothetical protein ROHU_027914 [Labeo rohita]
MTGYRRTKVFPGQPESPAFDRDPESLKNRAEASGRQLRLETVPSPAFANIRQIKSMRSCEQMGVLTRSVTGAVGSIMPETENDDECAGRSGRTDRLRALGIG